MTVDTFTVTAAEHSTRRNLEKHKMDCPQCGMHLGYGSEAQPTINVHRVSLSPRRKRDRACVHVDCFQAWRRHRRPEPLADEGYAGKHAVLGSIRTQVSFWTVRVSASEYHAWLTNWSEA